MGGKGLDVLRVRLTNKSWGRWGIIYSQADTGPLVFFAFTCVSFSLRSLAGKGGGSAIMSNAFGTVLASTIQ